MRPPGVREVMGLNRVEDSECFFLQVSSHVDQFTFHKVNKYLLFEVRTVSYGPSFLLFDLWPKREARGP